MNIKQKLTFVSIITFKLLILLYIGLTAQLPVFAQLVLMPVLILETLGLYGYLYESSLTPRKRAKAKIAGRIESRKTNMQMKPAA